MPARMPARLSPCILVRFMALIYNYPIFERNMKSQKLRQLVRAADGTREEFSQVLVIMRAYNTYLLFRRLLEFGLFVSLARGATFIYISHYHLKFYNNGDVASRWLPANFTTISSNSSSGITGGGGGGDKTYFTYDCLRTDCPLERFDLAPPEEPQMEFMATLAGLGRVRENMLDRLPVYVSCYPKLAAYNEPFQHQNTRAMLHFLASAVFGLLYLLLRTLQRANPSCNSMLLFLIAPKLARRANLARIERHLRDLKLSYTNFKHNQLLRRAQWDAELRPSNSRLYEPSLGIAETLLGPPPRPPSPSSSSSNSFSRSSGDRGPAYRSPDALRAELAGHLRNRRRSFRPVPRSSSSPPVERTYASDLDSALFRYSPPSGAGFGMLANRGHEQEEQEEQAQMRSSEGRELSRYERAFAQDCLPLIRTDWWHDRVHQFYNAAFLAMNVLIWLFLYAYITYNNWRTNQVVENFVRLRKLMNELHCGIERKLDNKHDHYEPLELSSLDLAWNYYTLVHLLFVEIGGPAVFTAGSILYLLLAGWEIRCWICELKHKLIILLPHIQNVMDELMRNNRYAILSFNQETKCAPSEGFSAPPGLAFEGPPPKGSQPTSVTHWHSLDLEAAEQDKQQVAPQQQRQQQQLASGVGSLGASRRMTASSIALDLGSSRPGRQPHEEDEGEGKQLFDFEPLRQKFKRDVSARFLVVLNQCLTRHDVRLANKHFLERHYDSNKPFDERTLVEVLEKIFVSYKLLEELYDEFQANTSLITLVFVTINYGMSLISVITIKADDKFAVEQIVLMSFCFFFPILFIINSAQVDSKSRALRVLIKNLVAIASCDRNLRLQHLTTLWLKMIYASETRGNISHTLQTRFSYVNLIQIILWTTTLLVCVLRLY